MQLLLRGEQASHEDVIDVAVKEELRSKDALNDEATDLVQQTGRWH